jgi:hypothetical protein
MAAVKTKLGRIPCFCCGHPVVVKENEHKTLTWACEECDVSSFAKKGTQAAGIVQKLLPAPPAPAPAPKPAAAPPGSVPKAPEPTPPAPPTTAGPFDFLGFKK